MLKARKLYVGLILILSAVVIYLGTLVAQDRGITPGNIPVDSIVQPEEWNYIITTDIKNSVPSLEVNGKKVKFSGKKMYLDDKLNVMLPLDIIGSAFSCAINNIEENNIELQKGNNVVKIHGVEQYIDISGKVIPVINPISVQYNQIYINSKVIELGFSYDSKWQANEITLILTSAYLTSWAGPVLEEDYPYGDGKYNPDAPVVKHVQEVQLIESKNLEAIKRAVFLNGGVETCMYTSMNRAGEKSVYYNEKNSSYCYIGTQAPNHDVVIVGWDDNYPKENFNSKLEADGAFICMNSWGEEFGDEGLFYVSYYDSNIVMHNAVYTRIEDVDNYDNIYQSDLCGWVGHLGYEEDSAYFANVYTAVGDEEIKAVGFYATGKDTSYEIYYVDGFAGEDSFNKRVYLQSGKFINGGFYTVNLENPIRILEGTRYAIVIKIKTPGTTKPIAIEYKAGHGTRNVDITDGEGYISYTGRSWEHVEESKECNICLKMYTDNISIE